jgi:hypothetical protein
MLSWARFGAVWRALVHFKAFAKQWPNKSSKAGVKYLVVSNADLDL